MTNDSSPQGSTPAWKPIPSKQRRVLGVLMEKAKTTPDVYPLSIASIVSGANQKSNRYPLMNLTPEQVEDELSALRQLGAAAEVQGSGRVPRYRHYGYDWMGVKGTEAAVMTELLLRGHQTLGELRSRASRFESIADLGTLQNIVRSLMDRNLIIALTPPGRGQIISHNLYTHDELKALKSKVATEGANVSESDDSLSEEAEADQLPRDVPTAPSSASSSSTASSHSIASSHASASRDSHDSGEVAALRMEVRELRETVDQLSARIAELEQLIRD